MKRFILLFFVVMPLSAIDLESITDAQVLMSMAWNEYDNQRLGDAFIIAQKAWSGSNYSEASYLMALIYESQGEHLLAQRYYERALSEDAYKALRTKYLYSLANNFRLSQDYNGYADTLKLIEREALPRENYEVAMRQREQAVRILMTNGLNRVVEMYRWEHNSSLMATEALALNAYHAGEEAQDVVALQGFLYAVVAKSGTIINRLRYYRPDYEFKTIELMLDDAMLYGELRDYIEESQFFRSYYFLAASINSYNGSSQSKVLFNRIRQRPEAGAWAKRAQSQFEKPFVDPYTLEESAYLPFKSRQG